MAVPFDQTYWTEPGKIEEKPRPTFTWHINLRPEQIRDGLRHLESPTFYTDFGDYQMTLDTAPMDGGECPECGETLHEVVWIYEMKIVVPYERKVLVEDRSGLKRFSFEVKKGTEGVPVSICSHSFDTFYHEYIALSRVRDSSRLDIVVTLELPPADIDRRIPIPVVHIRRDQCEYLNELWWSGKRADVHFAVKGRIFKAHREILAASSSKFRDQFRGVPASPEGPIKVIVNDIYDVNAFQAFLRCIYTGQIDNIDKWCTPLLMLAHRYKVDCVERLCIQFTNAVKDNSNPDAVESVFKREHDHTRALIEADLMRARECNAMKNKEKEGKDDPSVREENMKNSRLGQEESASTSLAPQYIIPLENQEGASLPGAPDEPPPPYRSPGQASLPAAGPASPSRDSPASKPNGSGRRSPPPDYSSSVTVEVGQQTPVASTSGSTSATTVAAAPSLPSTLSPPPQPRPRPRPRPRSARPAVPTNDLLPASKTHLNNWIEKQGLTVGTSGSRASSASRPSTASVASLPSTPTSLPSNDSNRDSNKTADSAPPPPPISPVPLTYLKLDVSALLANREFPVPRSASPAPSPSPSSVDSLERSPEPEARSTSVPDVKGASFAERVKSVSQTRRPEGLEQRLLSTAATDVAPVNTLPV
ncbi:unnamed protein product [Trichogramma brassicae]|uniref:BTB domain-containing protein n=1 Tax=Trichogramma brassicae TaxID=86971 RepID=A0A6H5IKJ5_9HYME|nr:unnamed protein product [Trichogramma brassicae]